MQFKKRWISPASNNAGRRMTSIGVSAKNLSPKQRGSRVVRCRATCNLVKTQTGERREAAAV